MVLDKELLPGFTDPVLNAQAGFRSILEAMSRPGRLCRIPDLPPAPAPLYPVTAAIFLTLLDLDTPLWLDCHTRQPALIHYLLFHCGCPVVEDSKRASFALIGDGRHVPSFDLFSPGLPEYPDRSTTLVVQVESLDNGRGTRLTGPGIESEARVEATGLEPGFWKSFQNNFKFFPLGVDVLLVSPQCICGLPRTTKVEI